jgi:hypothetical protein
MATMDRQDWLIFAAIGVALGFFVLRGFGSRRYY